MRENPYKSPEGVSTEPGERTTSLAQSQAMENVYWPNEHTNMLATHCAALLTGILTRTMTRLRHKYLGN